MFGVVAALGLAGLIAVMSFGGTVPGPTFRVMQGDTVELTMPNAASSTVTDWIDLHAVSGP